MPYIRSNLLYSEFLSRFLIEFILPGPSFRPRPQACSRLPEIAFVYILRFSFKRKLAFGDPRLRAFVSSMRGAHSGVIGNH